MQDIEIAASHATVLAPRANRLAHYAGKLAGVKMPVPESML